MYKLPVYSEFVLSGLTFVVGLYWFVAGLAKPRFIGPGLFVLLGALMSSKKLSKPVSLNGSLDASNFAKFETGLGCDWMPPKGYETVVWGAWPAAWAKKSSSPVAGAEKGSNAGS